VLLHDSGYLKLKADREGTGAKYTFVHVIRSCAFAAGYLPTVGFTGAEVDAVVAAIRCTGPRSKIEHIHFENELDRFIGEALATADFLGQMGAADYVEKLGPLYAEFEESDRFMHVAPEVRNFRTFEELLEKTPEFWSRVVLPKLVNDFQSVHRFLAQPYPDGPNPYLQAVERNFARVQTLLAARRVSGGAAKTPGSPA
jgi:hypothetical protein